MGTEADAVATANYDHYLLISLRKNQIRTQRSRAGNTGRSLAAVRPVLVWLLQEYRAKTRNSILVLFVSAIEGKPRKWTA